MRNIRVISDDDSLQAGVLPALREYNITQFTTADVPGHQHQVSSLCGLEVTGGEAQHEGIVYHQRGCKDSKLERWRRRGGVGGQVLGPTVEDEFPFRPSEPGTSHPSPSLYCPCSNAYQETSDPEHVEPDSESEPFR